MNGERKQKYIEIAKELLRKGDTSFVYTVISDSMKPLMKKGDKIVVVKKSFESLKKYQIIAFQNNTSGNSKIPTVHRIVKKLKDVKVFYKTKGDNAIYADKEFVKESHYIGIVDKIIKKNFVLNLNTKIGNMLSMVAYFLFYIKNFFKLFMYVLKNFFVTVFKKEDKIIFSDDLLILRQSVLTKISDWQKTVENGVSLLLPFIDVGKKVCDVSFGGGYCEESFNFTRKGIEVDYKNLSDTSENFYDVVICCRVINIVEKKEKRQDIYKFLKSLIAENGIILLSYIDKKNNSFIKIKRKIYKILYKKYDGPLSDDIVYANKYFVMKELSFGVVYNELKNFGFIIKDYKKNNNVINFLISKK